MSNAKRKIEGSATEAGGKLKKTAGKLVGNERLEAKGRVEELEGKSRKEAAKTRERVEGKAQELGGTIEKKVGKALGNEEMRAGGKAREILGDAKQRANKPS